MTSELILRIRQKCRPGTSWYTKMCRSWAGWTGLPVDSTTTAAQHTAQLTATLLPCFDPNLYDKLTLHKLSLVITKFLKLGGPCELVERTAKMRSCQMWSGTMYTHSLLNNDMTDGAECSCLEWVRINVFLSFCRHTMQVPFWQCPGKDNDDLIIGLSTAQCSHLRNGPI